MHIEKVDVNNKDDIEIIINVIYRTFCKFNKKDSSDKLVSKYDKIYWFNYNFGRTTNYFKKTSTIFFVMKDSKNIIWTIRGTKDKIINLYVIDKYHWKWVWKKLLNYFEDEAKKLWSKKIILKSSKYAYDFYLKNGYKQEDKKYLVKHL